MIGQYIIMPYFNFLIENTAVSNFFQMIVLFLITYVVVKFVCKGVVKWYKWFIIS